MPGVYLFSSFFFPFDASFLTVGDSCSSGLPFSAWAGQGSLGEQVLMAGEGRTCDNSAWQPQQHRADGMVFGDPESFSQHFCLKRVIVKG